MNKILVVIGLIIIDVVAAAGDQASSSTEHFTIDTGPSSSQFDESAYSTVRSYFSQRIKDFEVVQDAVRARVFKNAGYMIEKLLVDPPVPDHHLPSAILKFMQLTQQGGELYGFRAFVTASQALALYDRLLLAAIPGETKLKLLYWLTQEISVFREVVSAFDFTSTLHHVVSCLSEPLVTEIVAIISKLPEQTHGIPPEVIARVRARQPPPFDRIFPQNRLIAQVLARRLNLSGRGRLLAQPDVLFALLRYGLRFSLCDLVDVDYQNVPQVFSLVWPHPSNGLSWLKSFADRRLYCHARMLIRTPLFATWLLKAPANSIGLLCDMVAVPVCIFEELLAMPCFKRLLNVADTTGRTLLRAAFQARRLDLISLLISHPDIDLPSASGLFGYFSAAPLDEIRRLFALIAKTKALSLLRLDIATVYKLLIGALKADAADIIGWVVDVPEVVNHVDAQGRTLLHWAMAEAALNCITLLLSRSDVSITGSPLRAFPVRDRSAVLALLRLSATCGRLVELFRADIVTLYSLVVTEVVKLDRADVLGVVLDGVPELVHHVDFKGLKLLHWAMSEAALDCIALLVSRPDVPVTGGPLRSFPNGDRNAAHALLRLSVTCGRMVELLRADVPTLFYLLVADVIKPDRADVLCVVLDHVAKVVHFVDVQGRSLLHCAMAEAAHDCITLLLSRPDVPVTAGLLRSFPVRDRGAVHALLRRSATCERMLEMFLAELPTLGHLLVRHVISDDHSDVLDIVLDRVRNVPELGHKLLEAALQRPAPLCITSLLVRKFGSLSSLLLNAAALEATLNRAALDPELQSLLRSEQAAVCLLLVVAAIERDRVAPLKAALRAVPEIVNFRERDRTLFDWAVSHRARGCLSLLLSRPDLRLDKDSLQLLIDDQFNSEILAHEKVAELMRDNIDTVCDLLVKRAIEPDRSDLLRAALTVPFATDIVNHEISPQQTLFDLAYKRCAIGCVAVMLSVPGLQQSPQLDKKRFLEWLAAEGRHDLIKLAQEEPCRESEPEEPPLKRRREDSP